MNNVWDVAPRTEHGGVAAADVQVSAETRAATGAETGAEAGRADGTPVATAAAVEAGIEAEVATAEPTPLGLDAPEPSGDASVDQAVRRLTQVDVLPTELHGEVYEDVHRELREVLAGLDR
ncbi:hypothetical protein [Streptodolium elevatio]